MPPAQRQYDPLTDYHRISHFLIRTCATAGTHINWLQPRWEYMHYHPYIKNVDLQSIGVWESNGEIIGVVHPEHGAGTAYFEIDPRYKGLKPDMLEYAEKRISAEKDGVRGLKVYINDNDHDFRRLVSEKGYRRTDDCEPMTRLIIPGDFPEITVPDRFRLKSLADDNDLRKLDRVLWRGFNHGDEPPDDGIEERKFMQSAPNYNLDLQIVVEAPDGNFVSYCGMWYEPVNRIAYVEPVATDPDYRRMGLAAAAVKEGVRRCGELGAKTAHVGSTLPLYLSVGFQEIYNPRAWVGEWE